MQTLQEITIDVLKPRENVMHVVQEDSTRKIRLILLENNLPFYPAIDIGGLENLLAFVEFRKPDGHGGIYDTTSLGDPAVRIEDLEGSQNIFIVSLDGQCFTCPGWTQINVRFETEDGKRIHTFRIMVDVEPSASSDTESTDWNDLESIAGLRNRVAAISEDVVLLNAQAETCITYRGALAAETDMDETVTPGVYYKAANISLVNAPDGSAVNRARIVVFCGSDGQTAIVQLWFDTKDNRAWHRAKESSGYTWRSWEEFPNSTKTVSSKGELTENTDMNTVITPGMYFKTHNVALVNAPENMTAWRARIVVYSGGSENFVVQVWYDTTRNLTYQRVKTSPNYDWTDWAQVVDFDDLSSAISAAMSTALTLRPALTENTDMDTLIQTGMYYKAKDLSIVNGPPDSTQRARIVVYSGGSDTSVVQVWYDTHNSIIWHRTLENENYSWSSWEQTDPSVTLTLRPALTENTDMDTVIQPGMYYKAKNISLIHAPADSSTRARIIVFSGGGETSVVQIWCVTDANKIWHRMKSAATAPWSSWVCDTSSNDRYPGPVFDRTAQVYAALDELAASFGGRITHTTITDSSLDSTDLPEGETADDNKMRLYKIDTTPSHMVSGGYTISNTPLYQKPKALIIACQHGDEKASATYVVDFVRRLLTDPELNSVASAVEWHIVPVVNVWGFNHNTRNNAPTAGNADGYNINRDYSDTTYTYGENNPQTYGFVTVEAQAIKQLYLDNVYVFFLDVHQAGSSGGCGYTSVPNQLSNRLSDYKKLWRAIDRAGCTAQLWMQNDPNTVKTNDQITFNWGNPSDPPIGSNTTASAPAYIRGNPYWNTHVAEQNPVFCAGTIETQKRCTIISGSNTDYNRVAMCFGAVYVQAVIKELVETVLQINDCASSEYVVDDAQSTSITLAALDNSVYNYGELSSLTVTSYPSNGHFDITFTSGSTPTALTVPPTLALPDGFTVVANTRYEINVSNGYAVVGSWAVSA